MEQLCSRLGHLGELSRRLASVIDEGDAAGVIECVREGRGARAALRRTQVEMAMVSPTESPRVVELMAAARDLMDEVKLGDRITEQWLGRSLPEDKVMLGTENGTVYLADAMLPAVWDFEADLVVLVGAGLEALAEVLLSLGQARILVYLPDDQECEYSSKVLRIATVDEAAPAVMAMGVPKPMQVATRHSPFCDLERELQGKIVQRVQDTMADLRVHRNTIVNFATTWMSQGIANLSAIATIPSIETVGDAFAGLPVVIVAPGPSLSKNIAELKKYRDKVLVMGFSHSLAPLTRAGIDPDFVVSVDPQDVQYHFKQTDMSKVGCLLNGATVHEGLYKLGCPRTMSLAANSDLEKWIFGAFDESAQAAGGGSVATTALSIALGWKCNPIIFCGLDLSFSDGKLYVDTSVDGSTHVVRDDNGNVTSQGWSDDCMDMQKRCNPAATRTQRGVELPGYYGGTVTSDFMFSMFHRWFEGKAEEVDDTVQIINATEGGVFIKGMQHQPLHQTLEALSGSVDGSQVLDAAFAGIDLVAREKMMGTWVRSMLKDLDNCVSLANRCLRLVDQAHTEEGHLRLVEYEHRLSKSVASVPFVSMLAQPMIEQALEDANYAESVREALDSSRRTFEAVIRASKWVGPRLRTALRALQGRD